jgi:Mn2+/Fe2+ NRAMP family transporter
VLFPKHGSADKYEQISQIVSEPLGVWGYRLFGAGLFIACFGAALEISLDIAYVYSQAFGWSWGENKTPTAAARFSLVYTLMIFLAAILTAIGINPITLTIFSMALTTVILPLIVLPFLVLMNDPQYMREHVNSRFSNYVVIFIVLLSALLALVAIPLEIVGSK